MKLSLATLLLVSLVLSSSLHAMADDLNSCDTKCNARCKDAKEKDRCLKYCGICCGKCQCVPSGTYGNKSDCPCYDDMKNSKGTAKCP
ncbi:peamaclein-like [Syzygium oleosum]|uniref:peamaclein-like n=1 Tax=Syzygium oleosum TaxID=219896 RepID=UPI0024BAB0C9|nr:peamaclein-like [Syzygium oleosum]